MSEEERDKLHSQIRDLKEEIAQKERQYKLLEEEAAEFVKEVKVEKGKVADRDARIKKLHEEETAREEYIKGVEEETHGFQNKVKQLEREKAHLEAQVIQAKVERDTAIEAKRAIDQDFSGLHRDADGLKSELNAVNIDKTRLTQDNAQLLDAIKDLQHVEGELAEEQKLTAGLRAQLSRLRDEMPRFDLSPRPHVAPPDSDGQPKTPRSLANELEELNSDAGSSHESGAESDSSTDKAFSEGSTSSSSDAKDDEDCKDGKSQVIEVIRNVPGPAVSIYVPYQTFAHSPFTCWALVDLNFVLLFGSWLSWAASRTAPWLGRVLGTQNSGAATPTPTHQPPNGTTGASLPTPTGYTSSHPTNGPASPASPHTANSNGTTSQSTSMAPAIGNTLQSSTMADIANILRPAPTTNGSASQPLNGANNTIPTTTVAENGSATPTQNGASGVSSPPPSGGKRLSPPTLTVSNPAGTNGNQQAHPPQPPIDSRLADLIGPISRVEDSRPTIPTGENLPPSRGNGNRPYLPRTKWWTPHVESNNRPNATQTIFAMILHLIFYYVLWVCYLNYKERDLWRAANEATRILLVDILALRTRSGRGLVSHLLSEDVVRIIDRFILTAVSFFNVEIQAYPIPG